MGIGLLRMKRPGCTIIGTVVAKSEKREELLRILLAQVAPTPTHNGVMALTRSALASNASASAAHWIVFAAILCSVCTTILFWLIEWRNRRCSSERENLSTAKNEWKC